MASTLPVVEKFHSLQGEGAHVGRSAFFIRLASCKVGCSWCDTKNSWSTNNHPKESIDNISQAVANAYTKGAAFVVITGGEPLHHNLDTLCNAIRNITTRANTQPIPIHLETSGVDPLSGRPNWITLSPKRHAPPRKEIINTCQELKVIVHNQEDLLFAEDIAKHANKSSQPLLFLQPGWNAKEGEKLTLEYVKTHPQWRLSLQTHKWLGVL